MAPYPQLFRATGCRHETSDVFLVHFANAYGDDLVHSLPIVSVMIQSLFVQHEQVLVISKSCGPFGCQETTSIDTEATAALRESQPLGRFNGLGTYFDRSHLATAEVAEIWRTSEGLGSFLSGLMDLKFYKAMIFTLTYTFTVTPLVLILGLAVAVGVNNLPNALRGIAIFISLLPFLVATIVGSMILSWMVDGEGIIGATLQNIFNDPTLLSFFLIRKLKRLC